jgi:hypothetical protein
MTEDELQQLESNPALRIKFASIDSDGMFVSDASDDYQQFFADLPKDVSDWGARTADHVGENALRRAARRAYSASW